MGFRFYRRAKLFGGLGINFSKSGLSWSIRTKMGSISPKRASIRTGIPGLTYVVGSGRRKAYSTGGEGFSLFRFIWKLIVASFWSFIGLYIVFVYNQSFVYLYLYLVVTYFLFFPLRPITFLILNVLFHLFIFIINIFLNVINTFISLFYFIKSSLSDTTKPLIRDDSDKVGVKDKASSNDVKGLRNNSFLLIKEHIKEPTKSKIQEPANEHIAQAATEHVAEVTNSKVSEQANSNITDSKSSHITEPTKEKNYEPIAHWDDLSDMAARCCSLETILEHAKNDNTYALPEFKLSTFKKPYDNLRMVVIYDLVQAASILEIDFSQVTLERNLIMQAIAFFLYNDSNYHFQDRTRFEEMINLIEELKHSLNSINSHSTFLGKLVFQNDYFEYRTKFIDLILYITENNPYMKYYVDKIIKLL